MGNKQSQNREVSVAVAHEIEKLQLRNEINALKADNNELRKQLMVMYRGQLSTGNRRAVAEEPSFVSPEIVAQMVEQMLADPMTNLSFVPDFMERPMEQKALTYLLKALAKTVDTTRIEIAGHEILLHMQPVAKVENDVSPDCHETRDPQDAYSDYDDVSEGVVRSNDAGFDASKVKM